MKRLLRPLLPVLILVALTGCMHLPPGVAEELSAPDGRRPNHFAIIDGQAAAETGQPAESP
jgi:hypothetical protein